MPAIRRREGGYAGLCSIVCGQQLSTASAGGDPRRGCSRRSIRSTTIRCGSRARDKLARLGLSSAKIKSIKEIGKAIAKGTSISTPSPRWRPTRRTPR